ncbi:MAG: nucleotidyltransferase domain-containing protein [Verrucomicrobia bacterium]|nr:nucleotidyltransferase domain-containing protein [Verrucomicrobiota bacterium]
MTTPPLAPAELALLRGVFRRHPEITAVKLFGSRAKGTHAPHSDVDLALWGAVSELQAEAVAAELDELTLPYRYDVKPFAAISLRPLREHIERVGIPLYPDTVLD